MLRPQGVDPRSRTPTLLTFVLVIAILYLARDVLVPMALAVLLTFLLAPLVGYLERARLPRVVAVLLVVGVVGLCVGGLGWAFEHQIVDLAAKLPEYKTNIVAKIDRFRTSPHSVMGEAQKTISELGHELSKPPAVVAVPSGPLDQAVQPAPVPVKVVEPPTAPLAYAAAVLRPLVAPLTTAGIVIVFTVFMLIKREDLRNRFIRLVGQRDMRQTTQALDDAAQRVSRYLLMQSLVNGAAGILIGTGLFFLGVPNAWLWGLFAAIMRFVPYVGIWIAASLPLVVSLAVAPGWTQPVLVAALFAGVEAVCSNFVEPWLYGSGTGVAPLALLFAAVLWTWLWGGVGLLLSTPITVCLAVIGRHVPQLRFLRVILSDEPALSPPAQVYQRLLAEDAEEAGQIVEIFAKDKPPIEIYDTLLLPAIQMAEADRHEGDLNEERERSVGDALETIIYDIGDRLETRPGVQHGRETGGVVCLPARDRADELVAQMLAQVIRAMGIHAETLSARALPGELLEGVAERRPSVVCISAVPPGAGLRVRVLAKRLRARFPDLPIVVGLWDPRADPQAVRQKIGTVVTDRIATSLTLAVDLIRPLAFGPPPGEARRPEAATPAGAVASTFAGQRGQLSDTGDHERKRKLVGDAQEGPL